MARKRVCLAGFEKGEGPWVVATGAEGAVKVSPLKAGEEIVLEVEDQIGGLQCKDIVLARLTRGKRYRFVKNVADGIVPSKSCVEVVFKCQESPRS